MKVLEDTLAVNLEFSILGDCDLALQGSTSYVCTSSSTVRLSSEWTGYNSSLTFGGDDNPFLFDDGELSFDFVQPSGWFKSAVICLVFLLTYTMSNMRMEIVRMRRRLVPTAPMMMRVCRLRWTTGPGALVVTYKETSAGKKKGGAHVHHYFTCLIHSVQRGWLFVLAMACPGSSHIEGLLELHNAFMFCTHPSKQQLSSCLVSNQDRQSINLITVILEIYAQVKFLYINANSKWPTKFIQCHINFQNYGTNPY